MNVNLSIIIPSYNTKKLTEQCLTSLFNSISENKKLKSEVIVVDNGSTDGSVTNIKNQISNSKNTYKKSNITVNLIQNKTNLGYPKANNQALKIAKGKYVLFLNSDTIIEALNFNTILKYFENNPEVGVLTVKVLLENGSIDPASHRGFPTIWRSFCYFAGLEELFKHVPFFKKVFGGYHLVSLDKDKIHEIDSPAGAFYLTKRSILNKMNGFDESFFMYGEDLDLSFRIKKLGYKIIYYPKFEVIHLKHASGLDTSDVITRKKAKYHFFEAMKIFYRKHHEKNHFFLVNNFIYILIDILRKIYE